MNIRCFIFGISLTLYFAQDNGNVIKFTNLICESFNKTWFTFNECRLRAVNRNKTVININATVHYPANDVHVDAQVFKKANGYKPWLIKISLDGCRFIKKAYNPVAIIIFKMFREFSNINHSCPYVGTQLVRGFYPRAELLGLPFPTGEYLLQVIWTLHKSKTFTTNVYFTYTED